MNGFSGLRSFHGAHLYNAPVLDLHYHQFHALVLHARRSKFVPLGNIPQLIRNESGYRFVVVLLRKLHAEQPENLVRVSLAVNIVLILADLDYLGVLIVVFVLDIAYDSLDKILRCDNARSSAVFIGAMVLRYPST